MVRAPDNAGEVAWCREFMFARGAGVPAADAHFIMYLPAPKGPPSWVVSYDGWCGSTCQMHVASNGRSPIPREQARRCFDYAFGPLKRTHVFGLVNSLNTRAMRMDLWLGFKEILRIPGAHDGGGDLVLLQLRPKDWAERNLRYGKELATSA